jgi:hypothetical protein
MWKEMPFKVRVEVAIGAHQNLMTQFPQVFNESTPSISYILLCYLEPCFAKKGTYVFNFETGSGGVYMLVSGHGHLVDENENGEELVVGNLTNGQCFGVEAINGLKISFVGVRAACDMHMYYLSAAKLDELSICHPKLTAPLNEIINKIPSTLETGRNNKTAYNLGVAVAGNNRTKLPSILRSVSLSSSEEYVDTGIQAAQENVGDALDFMWQKDESDDPDFMYKRCVNDTSRNHRETVNLLRAVEKHSPSLTLSYMSRERFLEMKKSMWRSTTVKISVV